LPQGIKMEQFFARSFHLKKIPKTVSFGDSSKTSKSKADETIFIPCGKKLYSLL
jgi:hypothetical protein